MRYERQIILPEIGEEGQEKLRKSKVLIVGVGGLGSPISLYLTGAGVGTIGLVDDDVVSITNLQRQILYTEKELGLNKAICAQQHLSSLNSELTITSYPFRFSPENANELVSQYDIVVDGSDNFSTRYLINDTCKNLGKPYVYGAISGLEGQVSVFNFNSDFNYRSLYPDEEEMKAITHPFKGVLGVTPAIIGSVEASEVIKIICGYGEVLSGKLWTIDLRTMETHILCL